MMKIKGLSPREVEVLHLIAEEFTGKEIAQKLFISMATVETHKAKLLWKMNVRNTAGLIRRSFETGYLKIPMAS